MNNVKKNCLKKNVRKFFQSPLKISFHFNATHESQIQNAVYYVRFCAACWELQSLYKCTWILGLDWEPILVPQYTTMYYVHTGQCIVIAGQPRHVSFLNIHGFRPGFMTFNIRMCFATIHNGTEVFLKP